MGARDSKLLTPELRTLLNTRIRSAALKVSVVEAQPKEIDDVVLHAEKLRKLNFLEARMMGQVISELGPDVVYVDASDVNEARFGEDIRGFLPVAEGDENYFGAPCRQDLPCCLSGEHYRQGEARFFDCGFMAGVWRLRLRLYHRPENHGLST